MAKFFGNVGYVTMVKTAPGIMSEQETIRQYYGDEIQVGTKWVSSDKINDDFTVDSKISIVADGFAYQNFSGMRWVEWLGSKWKIASAQVESPRIVLTLGGVYNG